MPKLFAFWTRKKESKKENQHLAVVEDPFRRVEEILYPTSAQKEIIDVTDDGTTENSSDSEQTETKETQKNPKEWMYPNTQKQSITEILRSRKKTIN